MSENKNITDTQAAEVAALKAMFSDYKTKQTQTGVTTKTNTLASYFSLRNDNETFRPLPPLQGRKPIEEAFFHIVPTLTSGGRIKRGTTLYCPAHNDPKVPKLDETGQPVMDASGKVVMVHAPCPLCSKYNDLIRTQDRSIIGKKKEELNEYEKGVKAKNDKIFNDAKIWQARKHYIIKGIDKGAIKDGPKFWRFKDHFRKDGIFDKLVPMMSQFVNKHQVAFYDPNAGADFELMQTDAVFNNITYKQLVGVSLEQKPLHTDPVLAKSWLDDDTTWRDVFKPRKTSLFTAYQYLESVGDGVNPYWDESDANNKHWVYPNRPDLEAIANTRTMDLGAYEDKEIEQASDLIENYNPKSVVVPPVAAQAAVAPQAPVAAQAPVAPQAAVAPQAPVAAPTESYVQTLDDEPSIYDGSDDVGYEDLPF